jgi:putative tryptophan/tyrosine transport system substrate-binding protein
MPRLALGTDMKRRKFIALIGGAVAMPLAVRAQQNERIRRLGVLMSFAKDAPESARIGAFVQELQRLGWTDGRNLQIEYRWETSDLQKAAMELVALSPDVILVSTTPALSSMHHATKTVPVVFTQVSDPVTAGFVTSLAKPGGNITRFTVFDYEIGAKWLGLLREIAPNVTHVGVIREPTSTSSIGQFGAIQSAARLSKVEVSPLGGQDSEDIDRTVTEFAHGPNCGLISLATPLVTNNRNLIISLAARYRLPAVYPFPPYGADGGLICYGPDAIDPHRKAAGYVDRILKGEKPADLPVQASTKFELVINLKTAKALGLAVPQTLLDRADEVIE